MKKETSKMNNKILRDYVSEVDQFLQNFDKEHPKPTKSQEKEIVKYERIYHLRDTDTDQTEEKSIWEGF